MKISLFIFLLFLISHFSFLISIAWAAPSFSGITDNRTTYTDSRIPAYSKLEITFNVGNTIATNLWLPFSSAPPPGTETLKGISVDGEFTPDNWQTTYTHPGFFYREYQNQIKSGRDWIYPTGKHYWVVRFAPHKPGIWKYRLKAADGSGNVISEEKSFEVSASSNHGFIRVSPTDHRYFEYDDGNYFPALGYNMNFNQVDWQNPILTNEPNFKAMGQNGIQLLRIWLSQWKMYGAMWNDWRYTVDQYSDFSVTETYPGSDVSRRLTAKTHPCESSAHWLSAPIAVKPNTAYRIKARVKTVGLSGPEQAGKPYGFVVKTGELSWMGHTCENPDLGTRMTAAVTADSDWTTVEGIFTTQANQDYLDGIYITLENVSAGVAYNDGVWMEEAVGEWGSQTDILAQGWASYDLYADQRMSYAFDLVVELAEDNGVYLRTVLLDHNDWIFNHIDMNGQPITRTPQNSDENCTVDGFLETRTSSTSPWVKTTTPCVSNAWFYGYWREPTKVRWLQQAWWRYLQARWGYSTAIHSWENQNEGDPWNGLHYTMLDELGKYMNCGVFGQPMTSAEGWKCPYRHPNSHLVSDSNWHSYPVNNMWNNPNYPNIDFADFHNYYHEGSNYDIVTDNDTYSLPSNLFYDTAQAYKSISDILSPLGPESAGKPVMIGEMSFWSGGQAAQAFSNDTQGIWLHNFLWAQVVPSAVIPSYWDAQGYTGHIVCDNCVFGKTYDHRRLFGNYYRFIKDIPLSNGHYQDAAATTSNANIRAWGQKDLINNRSHIWVSNKNHTWKNVIDGANITPVSSSVTIPGFASNISLKLEKWDTYQGVVSTTGTITSDANGNIVLPVSSLSTDEAYKIGDYSVIITPSPTPAPTPGDANGDNLVDGIDYVIWLNHYSQSVSGPNVGDFDSSGRVDGVDYVIWLNHYGT